MVQRNLKDKEKKICEKQIKRMEEELEHFHWLKEYNQLMLDKGLYMNYKIKIKEFKQIKEQILVDIGFNKNKINNLKQQIKNGVEVKNNPAVG